MTKMEEPAERSVDHIMVKAIMNFLERDLRHRKIKMWIIGLSLILGPSLYWLTVYSFLGPDGIDGDYVARIHFSGNIGEGGNISEAKYVPAIKKAFEDKDAKAIVLTFNSGGGSPVQSSNIHNYLVREMKKHPDTPVVAIVNDIMASGAYMIGTAAQNIYANPSSIVGSIGVRMGGWAWDHTVVGERYGIERRVRTAGEHKDMFDPFGPERPEDAKRAERMLSVIHEHFIRTVLERREDRLNAAHEKLFDGSVWTGEEAIKLGLIDGIRDYAQVLDDFGVEQSVNYTPAGGFFASLKRNLGATVTDVFFEAINAAEQRAMNFR